MELHLPPFPAPQMLIAFAALIPLIAAGVSAIGGAVSSGIQKRAQKKANEANLELAKYQNQENLALWNKQNAYNTPAAQMTRYTDAGLSPNLIYGSGASGGNASSPPAVERATMAAEFGGSQGLAGLPGVLEQYQNFQMRQAQIKNLNAQTEATLYSNMHVLPFRGNIAQSDARLRDVALQKNTALLPYQIDAGKSDAATKAAGVAQAFQRIKLMTQEEQMNVLRIKGLNTMNELNQARALYQRYQNDFAKMGINNADNPAVRILSRMLQEMGLSDYSWLPKLKR